MTALELAVRFGKTLIIQEVDGVEPVLFPLLRGDLVSQGECDVQTCFMFLCQDMSPKIITEHRVIGSHNGFLFVVKKV